MMDGIDEKYICPICGTNSMQWMSADRACVNDECEYRENHIHNHETKMKQISDKIWIAEPTFMCTCICYDSLEEHKKKRGELKKLKDNGSTREDIMEFIKNRMKESGRWW